MRTLLVLVALCACGDRRARPHDAGAAAGAGAHSTDEVIALPFVRGRDAKSVMVLPARFAKATHTREDMGGLPMLRFDLGDEVALVIPSAPVAHWSLAQVEQLARGLGVEGAAEPSGDLVTIGPDASGRVAFGLRVVDGADAAVFALAGPELPTRQDLEWIASHTRVGAKVPRLRDLRPSLPLSGAYRTTSKVEWPTMVLDPRGYVSHVEPTSDATRDVEVMVQWATLDPTMPVFRYETEDGVFRTRELGGRHPIIYEARLRKVGDTLQLEARTPSGEPEIYVFEPVR